MYEGFFGLQERPFALLPDPSFLYLSKGHSTALTLLRYSLLNRQGFTVVSGEVGGGKTTLINRLLDEMKTGMTVGLINLSFLATAGELRRRRHQCSIHSLRQVSCSATHGPRQSARQAA